MTIPSTLTPFFWEYDLTTHDRQIAAPLIFERTQQYGAGPSCTGSSRTTRASRSGIGSLGLERNASHRQCGIPQTSSAVCSSGKRGTDRLQTEFETAGVCQRSNLFEQGDLVGEFAVIDQQVCSASARAIGKCALLQMSAETFFGLVREQPNPALGLMLDWSKKKSIEYEGGRLIILDLARVIQERDSRLDANLD